MSKIIVAYTVAGLALFGALFASLALSGLIRPGLTPEEIAEAETVKTPPPPPPTVYIPPVLEYDRIYRISHDTPIHAALPKEGAEPETDQRVLPAGGYFRYVQSLDTPGGPWFEIVIDDKGRESTMYLDGMDLRWKTVSPQYSQDEAAKMQQDAMIEQLRGAMALRRREPVVEAPPEPEPQTFEEWWAEAAQRMGGRTSANMIASGAAAGMATLLILGSIAMLAVLRREHAWSRASTHTVHDWEPGGDDDPFTYARKAAGDDELDEQDIEDKRHA